MIKQAIAKVVGYEDLSERQTEEVFEYIMTGRATPAQIASLITALRMKGETVDEITGAAKVMRKKALKISTGKEKTVVDTCGTGGSGKNIFNVSTVAAIILAACGVRVAKHGNKSASGRCGSADILEYLGVKIDITPKKVEKCVKEIDIGFLFAPLFHKAMKYAAVSRKETGIRTIFNLMGPLANPAGASCQVIGVYDGDLTETMAKVLGKLGVKKAFVVHGTDGVDEVSTGAKTKVSELKNNKVRTFFIRPEDFGVKRASLDLLTAGNIRKNAAAIREVLSGQSGPARDIALVNSSVGLIVAGKVSGYKAGMKMASEAIDSGRARSKLEELIKFTNS